MRGIRRARGGASGAGSDADASIREALDRVLDDDLDEAEAALAEAVRVDSDRVDAYLALARLYRRRGETGRAIRIHQNLLLRPDLPAAARERALLGLAGDFRNGGFLQRAIAAYEEVLDRRPREREALRALVRLHADARRYDRSLELARRLARVEGRDGRGAEARLYVEAARAAHAEGREDDARRALKRALKRDPGIARAWVELGAIEAHRGRPKAAIDAWRRVAALDRRAAEDVYPRLEAAHAAAGTPEDHEAWLRRRIEEAPGDTGARLALARALAARGEIEAAAAEARDLLDRDSDDLRAHAALGRALLAGGREAEALKALADLLAALDRRSEPGPPELLE